MAAIDQVKNQMTASFLEEDQVDLKKKRYLLKVKHTRWNDEAPFDLDARIWIGHTAQRFGRKREAQLGMYREQMKDLLGWFQDAKQYP